MKRSTRRLAFNLVEVVLAMLVVGIAMLAIIGMIPIGLNANRKAVGNSYAADSAEQMLGFYANWLGAEWTNRASNVGVNTPLPEQPCDISGLNDYATLEAFTRATSFDGNTLYEVEDTGDNTVYNGVYRIKQVTNDGTDDQVDFDAVIRVWKTPTTAWEYAGSGSWTPVTDTTYAKRVQVNVEVTWPAALPYHKRERAFYALEISNPNN